MNPLTEKKLNWFLNILFVVVAIAGVVLFSKYMLGWILPFLLAFVVSYAILPIIEFLNKKLKLNRTFASVLTVILVIALLLFGVSFGVYKLASELINYLQQLPELIQNFSAMADSIADKWEIFNSGLPFEISNAINSLQKGIESNLSSYVQTVAKVTINYASSFAASLPSALIFIIFFILATFFTSKDNAKIKQFIKNTLPQRANVQISKIKKSVFKAVTNYIKALLIIICITFVELLIGLSIIGVDYVFLFAFVIALVDALPVLGCGTVLIPWALIQIISGNYKIGISLFILYGIILLIRQVIEPRIVSGQLGIHPLISLISIYASYRIIGAFGMIIGPLIAFCIVAFYKTSIFYKEPQPVDNNKT